MKHCILELQKMFYVNGLLFTILLRLICFKAYNLSRINKKDAIISVLKVIKTLNFLYILVSLFFLFLLLFSVSSTSWIFLKCYYITVTSVIATLKKSHIIWEAPLLKIELQKVKNKNSRKSEDLLNIVF